MINYRLNRQLIDQLRSNFECVNALRILSMSVLFLMFYFTVPTSYAQTKTLSVSLDIPMAFVSTLMEKSLKLDDKNQTVFSQDECAPITLTDPNIYIEDGLLNLKAHIDSEIGLEVLGQCVSFIPFKGQLHIAMTATAQQEPPAIVFKPKSAELIKDGNPDSATNKLLSLIATKQLLPRLDEFQVNIASALDSLDQLIDDWTAADNDNRQSLSKKSRLDAIRLTPQGVNANLLFQVAPAEKSLAEPPLKANELEAWQGVEDELDGFITFIVLHLLDANMASERQSELLDILIDTRYAIAEALTTEIQSSEKYDNSDSIRNLFIDAWNKLRPYLQAVNLNNHNTDNMYQFLGFLAGGDALKALDGLGPEYGIEITRDGLRRMARMLLGNEAPASFTPLPLEINPRLRNYFNVGETPELPADDMSVDVFEDNANGDKDENGSGESNKGENAEAETQLNQNQNQNLERLRESEDSINVPEKSPKVEPTFNQHGRNDSVKVSPGHSGQNFSLISLFINSAQAAQRKFRGLVADEESVDDYLKVANTFIENQTEEFIAKEHRIPSDKINDFKTLVKATAWKESCWRQYLGSTHNPKLITSSVGAVGMMQINARVWRGIYDIDKLKESVAYNIYAGTKILEHYFMDYAIRKGEDTKGNPYYATYSAYNGGPGHLARYRKDTTSTHLKVIDEAFARSFESIKSTGLPNISACYTL